MAFHPSIITRRESTTIATRGRRYVKHVDQDFAKIELNFIKTIVYGTRPYTVSIKKEKNGHYTDHCTCPYTATCKHTIALAYVIDKIPHWKLTLDGDVTDAKPQNTQWLKTTYKKISSKVNSEEKEKKSLDHLGLAYVLSSFVEDEDDDFSSYSFGNQEKNEPPILGIKVYKYRKIKSSSEIRLNIRSYQPVDLLEQKPQVLHRDLDFKILKLLEIFKNKNFGWAYKNDPIAIPKMLLNKILALLAMADHVFWQDEHDERSKLLIQNKEASFSIHGKINKDGLNWQKKIKVGEEILQEEITNIFDYQPAVALTNTHKLFQLNNKNDASMLTTLINATPVSNEDLADNKIIQELNFISQHAPLHLPTEWSKEAIKLEPTPVVYLKLKAAKWDISLKFRYQDHEFALQQDVTPLFMVKDSKSKNVFALRDLKLENNYLKKLTDIFNIRDKTVGHFTIDSEDVKKSITQILENIPRNWEVWIDSDNKPVNRSKGNFNFENKSGIDWLEISGDITFNDKKLELAKIVGTVLDSESLLKIDGERFLLSSAQLNKIKKLQRLYDPNQKKIRLHRTHLGLLEDFSDIVDNEKLHKQWQKSLLALKNFKGIKKTKQSKNLKAKLRDYQQTGLNWLYFLRECGFGGILADDMGLGKTVQALALLSFSHEKLKKQKPSLIVAPTSVVYNWEQELKKFTPKFKVNIFMGKDRALPKKGSADVVLTSYALVWRDIEKLEKINWHYTILDESQYIKNSKSKTFKAICSVNTDHRLSLTGTPLENNLSELWSQFSFVNPGLFGSLSQFKKDYQNPIEKQQNEGAKKQFKKMIKPFLLRRSKKEVLKDLPSKIEEIKWCEMDKKQSDLYHAVKTYYQAKVFDLIENKGIAKGQFVILNALLRLRQICCHPQLLKLDSKKNSIKLPKRLQKVNSSVKTEVVVEMLKALVAEGHKVLLFSQFTSMLDILILQLKEAGVTTLVLTGKTSHKQRQALIKKFQENDEPCVFLLSLKAGGTGLNLTAASYVMHYDPWWNPAVELQATDRAHRIGQKNSVNVYKFLVKDTIEEKILELQERKKGLIDDLIKSSGSKRLTKKDLEFLFE